MKGEKVSTPLDKDGRGPSGLYNTHTVKALPPTSWHLTMFFDFFFFSRSTGRASPALSFSPHHLFPQPRRAQGSAVPSCCRGWCTAAPRSFALTPSARNFAITWTPRPPACQQCWGRADASTTAPRRAQKHNLSQGKESSSSKMQVAGWPTQGRECCRTRGQTKPPQTQLHSMCYAMQCWIHREMPPGVIQQLLCTGEEARPHLALVKFFWTVKKAEKLHKVI